MTTIGKPLYRVEATTELIEEWFQVKTGREIPADVDMFRVLGGKYGLNFLALLCVGFADTKGFAGSPYDNAKKIEGLAQHLAAFAGTQQIWNLFQKSNYEDFVLRETALLLHQGYFGCAEKLRDLGGKDEKGRLLWSEDVKYGTKVEGLYNEVIKYCVGQYHTPVKPEFPEPPPLKPEPPKEKEPETKVPDTEIPKKPVAEEGIIWKRLMQALKTLQPWVAKVNPWAGWIVLAIYSILDWFY